MRMRTHGFRFLFASFVAGMLPSKALVLVLCSAILLLVWWNYDFSEKVVFRANADVSKTGEQPRAESGAAQQACATNEDLVAATKGIADAQAQLRGECQSALAGCKAASHLTTTTHTDAQQKMLAEIQQQQTAIADSIERVKEMQQQQAIQQQQQQRKAEAIETPRANEQLTNSVQPQPPGLWERMAKAERLPKGEGDKLDLHVFLARSKPRPIFLAEEGRDVWAYLKAEEAEQTIHIILDRILDSQRCTRPMPNSNSKNTQLARPNLVLDMGANEGMCVRVIVVVCVASHVVDDVQVRVDGWCVRLSCESVRAASMCLFLFTILIFSHR